jgi:hypothetical protein
MPSYQRLVGGVIYTVDFVGRDIAVDPVDAGPQTAEDTARFL